MSETKFAQANNILIAYQSMGSEEDPAIILVAGLYNQLIRWPNAFCESLVNRGYRVIRFDNRDVGLSDKMHGQRAPSFFRIALKSLFGIPVKIPYTLSDMADDTVGLMDALGIEKAHVVGMSMGGMISQIVAGRYSQRVLSLTSIMSTTGALGVGQASPAVAKQMVKPIPKGVSALQNSVNTRQMFASPAYPQTDEEVAAEVQQEFERSNYPAGYLRQMAAARISPNRKKLLQTIKVPTLIIHGNQDTLVNVSGGIETARHIPHAKLVRFEGMGHTLPAALLETFVDLIDETARQSES